MACASPTRCDQNHLGHFSPFGKSFSRIITLHVTQAAVGMNTTGIISNPLSTVNKSRIRRDHNFVSSFVWVPLAYSSCSLRRRILPVGSLGILHAMSRRIADLQITHLIDHLEPSAQPLVLAQPQSYPLIKSH